MSDVAGLASFFGSPSQSSSAPSTGDAAAPAGATTGATGGGSPASLQEALGHYADPSSLDLDGSEARDSAIFQKNHPGDAMGLAYEHLKEHNAASHPSALLGGGEQPDDDAKLLGPMDTPEDRLKVLDSMTQESTADPGGKVRCGPTALVGGAMLAGGTDGISTLVSAMESEENDPKKKEALEARLQGVKDKLALIKNGDGGSVAALDAGDMHDLEANLYSEMRERSPDNKTTPGAPDAPAQGPGVTGYQMDGFLKGDPALQQMFLKNNLDLALDSDKKGPGGENHWVLDVDRNTPHAAVYDPSLREGGQVTSNQAEVGDYHEATKAIASGAD